VPTVHAFGGTGIFKVIDTDDMSFFYSLKAHFDQVSILRSLYGLSKNFIMIVPFYLVQEKLVNSNTQISKPKFDETCISVNLLKLEDMALLAENPEVVETERALINRLKNGWICIGLRYGGKLAAYNWANLLMCDSRYIRFNLNESEAYLTYARTFKKYRGKNLAPYLRIRMYEQLNSMGRKRFYSITEYFNISAIRFKKKLNVSPVKFGIWLRFFNKHEATLIFKRYKKLPENRT
jgi:hypothetical protein